MSKKSQYVKSLIDVCVCLCVRVCVFVCLLAYVQTVWIAYISTHTHACEFAYHTWCMHEHHYAYPACGISHTHVWICMNVWAPVSTCVWSKSPASHLSLLNTLLSLSPNSPPPTLSPCRAFLARPVPPRLSSPQWDLCLHGILLDKACFHLDRTLTAHSSTLLSHTKHAHTHTGPFIVRQDRQTSHNNKTDTHHKEGMK